MLVVHATRKLLDRVGRPTVEPTTRSTTVLAPLAPAATLLERLPSWLAATLQAHDVPRTFIDAELAQTAAVGVARTNNRSVLGVMNEFAQLASWHKGTVRNDDDLVDIALDLAQVPTSPLYKRHVSPDR